MDEPKARLYRSRNYPVRAGMFEDVVGFLEETLSEKHVPFPLQNQLSIILDELVSNIVKYSGATSLDFGVAVDPDVIALRFIYDGDDFDVTKTPAPKLSGRAQERPIGGLGLMMVKKMSDRFVYECQREHNIVLVEKKFGPMPQKDNL